MSDFWPREDRIKMVQVFEAVADNITPPSSADIGRFDPHARFRQPDPTKDPENPTMWTTWHIETHTPELVMVPDAGHAFLPEQPDRIARALLVFIGRREREIR